MATDLPPIEYPIPTFATEAEATAWRDANCGRRGAGSLRCWIRNMQKSRETLAAVNEAVARENMEHPPSPKPRPRDLVRAEAVARTMTVTELDGDAEIDREYGGIIMWRRFRVQRPGGQPHTVSVEVTESGTPQQERCDCAGYRHRGECSHIDAVYYAGVLTVQWD